MQADLVDLEEADDDADSDEDEEDENMGDPIATERKKRIRHTEHLKARAGEPRKPRVEEIIKLGPSFLNELRQVLA
jgi:hypothetical protein